MTPRPPSFNPLPSLGFLRPMHTHKVLVPKNVPIRHWMESDMFLPPPPPDRIAFAFSCVENCQTVVRFDAGCPFDFFVIYQVPPLFLGQSGSPLPDGWPFRLPLNHPKVNLFFCLPPPLGTQSPLPLALAHCVPPSFWALTVGFIRQFFPFCPFTA